MLTKRGAAEQEVGRKSRSACPPRSDSYLYQRTDGWMSSTKAKMKLINKSRVGELFHLLAPQKGGKPCGGGRVKRSSDGGAGSQDSFFTSWGSHHQRSYPSRTLAGARKLLAAACWWHTVCISVWELNVGGKKVKNTTLLATQPSSSRGELLCEWIMRWIIKSCSLIIWLIHPAHGKNNTHFGPDSRFQIPPLRVQIQGGLGIQDMLSMGPRTLESVVHCLWSRI